MGKHVYASSGNDKWKVVLYLNSIAGWQAIKYTIKSIKKGL